MELDEIVDVLVAELEREKNVREKTEVGDRQVKGESRRSTKEVSVKLKNRVEGGKSGNGIEQVRLNNVRVRSEKGTGKQGEWIKVKGGRSKKISPKGIDVKNRFNILDQMDEESNIVREREDGTNDIVLGDSSLARDLGIELSNIRNKASVHMKVLKFSMKNLKLSFFSQLIPKLIYLIVKYVFYPKSVFVCFIGQKIK